MCLLFDGDDGFRDNGCRCITQGGVGGYGPGTRALNLTCEAGWGESFWLLI